MHDLLTFKTSCGAWLHIKKSSVGLGQTEQIAQTGVTCQAEMRNVDDCSTCEMMRPCHGALCLLVVWISGTVQSVYNTAATWQGSIHGCDLNKNTKLAAYSRYFSQSVLIKACLTSAYLLPLLQVWESILWRYSQSFSCFPLLKGISGMFFPIWSNHRGCWFLDKL